MKKPDRLEHCGIFLTPSERGVKYQVALFWKVLPRHRQFGQLSVAHLASERGGLDMAEARQEAYRILRALRIPRRQERKAKGKRKGKR